MRGVVWGLTLLYLQTSENHGSRDACSSYVVRPNDLETKSGIIIPAAERKGKSICSPAAVEVGGEGEGEEKKGIEEPRILRDLKLNTVASLGLETVSRKRNYKARKAGGDEAFGS